MCHKAHHRRRRMLHCYSTGDGSISSHEGTLAPPCEYDWTCASFGPLESTIETANGSVQPFLHSLRQRAPVLYNGRPYPPKLPLPMGDLELPCKTMLWAHASPQPKRHLDRFSRVCTDDYGLSLYFTMVCLFKLFPSQNCPFPCWHLGLM